MARASARSSTGTCRRATTRSFNLVVPRSRCPAVRHADHGASTTFRCCRWLRAARQVRVLQRADLARVIRRSKLVDRRLVGRRRHGISAAALRGRSLRLALWTLIALTFIDADTQLLPDDITLPLLWPGLLAQPFGAVHAAARCGARRGRRLPALWTVYWAVQAATGKEGMGYGDFKLLAALGAWLGWQVLLPIMLLASVVGAVVGIVLIGLSRRGDGDSDSLRPVPGDGAAAIAHALRRRAADGASSAQLSASDCASA